MREHNLKKAPGYTVTYSVISPPQEWNWDQEGLEAGIEITDIHVLGRRVDDAKLASLLKANNDVWVGEILEALKTALL